MNQLTIAGLGERVGQELGSSDWVTIDQARVNTFANSTGDDQWIHVDAGRAKRESPFFGPIAHGYLTLSIVAALSTQVGIIPKDAAPGLNYEMDRVRFLAPVPASARVRLRVVRAGSSRRMAADRHENLEHARGGGIGHASFDRRSFGAPQLLAMAGWGSLPCLWLLRQPTLVLMGSDYPLVLPVNGRILASLIPNAELRMIDDGHLFMVTWPAEVTVVMEEFLAKESK